MPEIPIMWYPIFRKLITTAVTWANILFEYAKLFKVEKGSPKICDVMGGFPSTQTQQIIMFIEMTYKIVFDFLYLQVAILQATVI